MNRPIKFRAWQKSEKLMWQDVQNAYDTLEEHGNEGKVLTPTSFGDVLKDEDFEVMQFTGLLDRNGREVYEGDFVKLDSWSPAEMQICFIEGTFCLANKDGEFVGDIHYIQHADTPQAEVIGNIYQNSELLK